MTILDGGLRRALRPVAAPDSLNGRVDDQPVVRSVPATTPGVLDLRTATRPSSTRTPTVPRPRSPRSATPLVDALRAHVGRGTVAFSCPGHKGGAGADPALRDLLGEGTFTNDVWLDTATYDTARREAERKIADLWGAERAFVLVNGSTSGNHALLLATVGPGDTVVCARDAHVSTHTGLILTGARPVWVSPDQDPGWEVGTGITPYALDAALEANPDAKLAIVVSPTYAGVCSDLPRLVAVAHRRGVPLVVDEAWGPHLRFGASAGLPVDALTAGADAVITSTHKLLSSLSQSSVLLVRGGRLSVDRVAAAVRMTQTTSPYLPLVASVDSCRAQLEDDGPALVGWAVDLARLARTLLARVPGLRVLESEDLGLTGPRTYGGLDPCKIVIDVRGRGMTGLAADRALRDVHGIAVEGSDPGRLYLVVGPGDSVASVRRLVLALAALGSPDQGASPRTRPPVPAMPEQSVSPRDAYFASHERVPLAKAAGRVCAELVTPYPPGIPVLAPGEVVTAELVQWLQCAVAAGVHLHGPDDPTVATLRVLATA